MGQEGNQRVPRAWLRRFVPQRHPACFERRESRVNVVDEEGDVLDPFAAPPQPFRVKPVCSERLDQFQQHAAEMDEGDPQQSRAVVLPGEDLQPEGT